MQEEENVVKEGKKETKETKDRNEPVPCITIAGRIPCIVIRLEAEELPEKKAGRPK